MAGSTFTIGTQFGVSSGPTYTGSTAIAPGNTGNVIVNLDKFIPAGNTLVATTILTDSLSVADVQAFGIATRTIDLNSNPNTPAVTVVFNGASGAANLSFAQSAGMAVAYPTAAAGGWNTNTNTVTSISVFPDGTSNTQVSILIAMVK